MKFFFIYLLLLTCLSADAQCLFKNIIPFEIGMSTFDASIIIDSSKNFNNIPKYSDYSESYIEAIFGKNPGIDSWKSDLGYLEEKADFTKLMTYYSNNSCVNVKEYFIHLYFVEDYLYKIDSRLIYDNYEDLLFQYNNLVSLVPMLYKYKTDITINNNSVGRKIGEGVDFYKTKNSEPEDKVDRISISYKINYKIKTINNETVLTNTIDYYSLDINFVNLNNTPLKNKRY